MPKPISKPSLHINILHPQSQPEEVYIRITRWLLSTGRFIIIFVEIIVLGAFVSRFKLDNDLANNKDAIDRQIPFIESLKSDELLIRKAQLQLATVRDIRTNTYNYPEFLQRISAQTPSGIKVINISLENLSTEVSLKISGQARNNTDLGTFLSGLKSDNAFSNIELDSAGLDQGVITFSISGASSKKGLDL